MAGINSISSNSLDINSIVSQLMTVESRRKASLQKQEAGYQLKLTAVGNLSSALSNFKTALSSLRATSNFQVVNATSADTSVFSATADSTTKAGIYDIEVTQLARANMLTSTAYADKTTAIATGTLTIQVGTGAAKAITIDASNNSLSGISDAINKAGTDVTASIINDGTGYKLMLTANKMGSSNTIKVTVTGDSDGNNTDAAGLSNLMYDPAGTKRMTEIQTAQSATLKLGTLSITKDSNSISDVIPGVTLNLAKAQVGTPVKLTVANSTGTVMANISKFVTEYNNLTKAISDLGNYDPTTKKGGPLVGDSTLRQIQRETRDIIGNAVPGLDSGINTLAQVGIVTQKDGSLTADMAKLNSALNENYDSVVKLFAKVGTATDANISMVTSTDKSVAGSYAVNITQAATQGKILGGGAIGSLTVDGTNNTLNLSINGIAGTITIASATYASNAALASEIQSKINGLSAFSSVGITATVTESGGVLTITSSSYGSASTVNTISGNAATNLALDTGTSTAGVNVAGTIGGYAATGFGQKLTGDAGNNVEGLAIKILGTTTGARGTFTYSLGTAESLYRKLDAWLNPDTGIIRAKNDGIKSTISSIVKSEEREDARLVQVEKRLRAQFVGLQSLLDNMQGVGNFLSSQMTGLEKLIKG